MVSNLAHKVIYHPLFGSSLDSSDNDGGMFIDILNPIPTSSVSALSTICEYGELDEEVDDEKCLFLRITLSRVSFISGSRKVCYSLS